MRGAACSEESSFELLFTIVCALKTLGVNCFACLSCVLTS